jgi:putative ABC transport system permease protein
MRYLLSYRKSSLIAWRALRRNRLQTGLTVLGMMIGVGTVLVMVAIGSGAQRSITGQVRAAGMNIIMVTSGNFRMQQQWTSQGEAEEPSAWNPQQPQPLQDGVYRPQSSTYYLRQTQTNPADNPIQQLEHGPDSLAGLGAATTLTLNDAAALATLHGVEAVSGGQHENASVIASGSSWFSQMRGEQATLPVIRRAWIMSHGRFFTKSEDAHADHVAVLGSVVSQRLFGTRDPTGERITVHGTPFQVIGVVASGSWMVPASAGDGQFDAVYVPVHTSQAALRRSNLDSITVASRSTGEVTHLTRQIVIDLRVRHHLNHKMADDFSVASQARTALAKGGMRTDISRAMMGNADTLDKVTLAQLGKTLEQASRTMSVLLASIAAVSLIVGGIGIMNIMLLSVTERTREIGIRRAVGAQSAEVMQQFLCEAIILSLGGGLLGIAFGALASMMVAHAVQWSTELSWLAIVVSFTISAAIGILFGWYPARQASRVSPMTSLRYE